MSRGKSVQPSDFTGKEVERLRQVHAEELKAAAKTMAMVSGSLQEDDDKVIEVKAQNPDAEVAPVVDPDVVVVDGTVADDGIVVETGIIEVPAVERKVQMRVNSDVDQMTLGAGTSYTFLVGKVYNVPKFIYDHLEELGYVYH